MRKVVCLKDRDFERNSQPSLVSGAEGKQKRRLKDSGTNLTKSQNCPEVEQNRAAK